MLNEKDFCFCYNLKDRLDEFADDENEILIFRETMKYLTPKLSSVFDLSFRTGI
jgi:hypothetical protein